MNRYLIINYSRITNNILEVNIIIKEILMVRVKHMVVN